MLQQIKQGRSGGGRRSLEDSSWYDNVPPEVALRKQPSIQFADEAEECEAATVASSTAPARQVRARVGTGFIPQGEKFDIEDEEHDDVSLKDVLTSARRSRMTMRQSVDYTKVGGSVFFRADAKRQLQHHVIGMGEAQLAQDSPELKINEHKVDDYIKNEKLLHKSLYGRSY